MAEAWGIIRDHYCVALGSQGLCPIQCERCREELVDLFRLEEAKNPAALLTWLAKDRSARMIERLIAAQKEAEFQAMENRETAPEKLLGRPVPRGGTRISSRN